MSTGKSNITAKRILHLQHSGQNIFHTKDLALLWNIPDTNTLYTTLKRYSQQGLLQRISKGLYTSMPIESLDPVNLAIKTLHQYAYVSTETVLAQEGIVNLTTKTITLISGISKKFQIARIPCISRKLCDRALYHTIGIQKKNGILFASRERAVADLLYFRPQAILDGASRIHWNQVHEIQKTLSYPLTPKRYL